MARFILFRTISMIFVLFAISVLVFLIFFATPGVDPASVVKLAMPRSCNSAPLTAVMLIGVACTVEMRFSAVTIISSVVGPEASATD